MEPTFQVLPPDSGRIPPQQPKPQPQGIMAMLAAGAFVLFKYGLVVLKTGGSMFLMIWIYSQQFGWWFAAGFVFLIFVHEMGHVIAAKLVGIPVTAPLFIPFVGAFISMKENPRDAWTEALMAYGGPLAGGVGSWICWWMAISFHSSLLMAVASASFLINLFNMIPFPPLDGGRICAAVSPWFWFIGLLLMAAAIYYFHSTSATVIIVTMLIFGFFRLKSTFMNRDPEMIRRYHDVGLSNRLTMALMYVGLIAFLLLGYWDASNHLSYLWDEGN